ncbi:MAG: DEAD/DEAH box helicase [Flavobacteriales bacterium]
MTTFSELGLSAPLLKALSEMGIETPSPIQAQAIPILTGERKNFIGLAQTGTGKTAAFGLPLLATLKPEVRHTQALVLAPTRELGQQIAQQLQLFAKYMPTIRIQVVYGGASISEQIRGLKQTPHILIATPGRLMDLMDRKALSINDITHVVLDEADEMLNMGFKEDIDEILSHTPDDKVTWLFSATMPREIRRIVSKYMPEAAEVAVNKGGEMNKKIAHQYAVVREADKTEALKRFAAVNEDMRGIVFCRTKIATQALSEELKRADVKAEALHGDMSQAQRDQVMKRFKAGNLKVLIATDVAARGIDVNDLTHVFHHSLPDSLPYYTHRSGRTARAGKEGISIAFVSASEVRKLKMFERELQLKFERVMIPQGGEIGLIKLTQWAESIAAAKDAVSNAAVALKIDEIFAQFSKEELVAKLVNNELKKLSFDSRDLNEVSRTTDRRDGGRGDRKSSGGMRFFINIGEFDRMSNRELVDMIVEQTQLPTSEVVVVRMEERHSYFEVPMQHAAKVAGDFNQFQLGGREIRVNRADQGGGGRRDDRGGERRSGGFTRRDGGGGGRSFSGGGGRREGGRGFSGGGGRRDGGRREGGRR